MLARAHRAAVVTASTDPGPDDPGDGLRRRGGHREDLLASTDPGPDDPGDMGGPATVADVTLELQRIRGRMTPVTAHRVALFDARRRASTDPGPDDPGDPILPVEHGLWRPRFNGSGAG